LLADFFFKFEKSVFQFCDTIFFEKMSKISQFKIRKPKNSKTSQNVLLKNPQNSIRKNVSLGFTMKWNPRSSHKINPHQSIMRKPIAKKKEKEKNQQKKS